MIKNSSRQTGSVHIIIVVALVIVLLGALGFVFWKNFVAKDDAASTPTAQTNTQKDAPKKVAYKTYQTDTYPISFKYPETWSIENAQADDQYGFVRSVDVKTDKGDKITFSVGGQGIGGLCGSVNPTRSTIDVTATTLKTPKLTTLSYTITTNADGSYDATYGLTDTYTKVGEAQLCDNVFDYLFDSGSETYKLIGFSGEKHFTSLDDAKQFVSSDDYAAIKKMILTLHY